jgi:hypothetical protein
MGFWDKSLQIFKCLCDNATQSVRQLAQPTGLSTSRVPRLQQAMERRHSHPASWFWATEDGRLGLRRLVGATRALFGLKRGVGRDTMREFFAHRHLEAQAGCAPSALRSVMPALAAALLETAEAWAKDGCTRDEVREMIGTVDETCLERMMLVFLDLPTGSLLLEEVAEERTSTTWKGVGDARLKALGAGSRSLVSDRAKALIQLAAQGFACLRMPDFFHGLHALTKRSALAIGRRLPPAHTQLEAAEQALARHLARTSVTPASLQAQAAGAASRTEVRRWEEVRSTYRHPLATLSLTRHPCTLRDSTPPTSVQVDTRF